MADLKKAATSQVLPFSAGEVISVSIESLARGGEGVARLNDLVIFVPLAAPGDELRVQVLEIKKNFVRAKIVEIVNAAPHRRKPECPVFGVCGGCDWQHVQYKEQLNQKQQAVEAEFTKSRLKAEKFSPIVASPEEWNYRNRIQVKVKENQIGFFKTGSHELVEFESCLITDKTINQQLKESRSKFLGVAKTTRGSFRSNNFRTLELFLNENNEVSDSWDHEHGEEFGFSQINSAVNTKLIETVLKLVKKYPHSELYDLYSGTGNFTLPLRNSFPKTKITSVELNAKAVEIAKAKIPQTEFGLTKFLQLDVAAFLNTNLKTKSLDKDSFVILDPPRAGCATRVIELLGKWQPSTILYIGCDLSHLVRDLKLLLGQRDSKYEIVSVQPFDMFPQTHHIETLVLIQRKN